MSETLPLICLIEDDAETALAYSRYLERHGFRVEVHGNGADAVDWIAGRDPAAILLDANLPGRDGFDVCRELRPEFNGGIIMLTGRDENVDKILGYELGADGYLTKPAEPRLVLAVLKSCLRRYGHPAQDAMPNRIEFGSLIIDRAARTVGFRSRDVQLSTAEFDLLWYLASHAGNVVSRDELQRALRGFDHDGLDRSVDMRISRLRRHFGDSSKNPIKLKTIRNKGYLLNPAAWN